MTISSNIKTLCESSGLSQTEFADKFNVNKKTLWGYMNGGHMPNVEFLIQLSQYYSVTIDFLLSEKIKVDKSGNIMNRPHFLQSAAVRLEKAERLTNELKICVESYTNRIMDLIQGGSGNKRGNRLSENYKKIVYVNY